MSPTLRSASDGRENASPSVFRHLERDDFAAKPFVLLGDAVLSYGALRDLVRRTAVLFALSGIAAGDRIVICSPYDIEVIALLSADYGLAVPRRCTATAALTRTRSNSARRRCRPTCRSA